MIFNINYTKRIDNSILTYDDKELSFDMKPWKNEIDYNLTINNISLGVIDNEIIQIDGFCGLRKEMNSAYSPPFVKSGVLEILNILTPGFSYSISETDFPIYTNVKTGWICIGNPEIEGNAVEFLNNCIAVLNEDKNLIALWLKPKSLPYFLF